MRPCFATTVEFGLLLRCLSGQDLLAEPFPSLPEDFSRQRFLDACRRHDILPLGRRALARVASTDRQGPDRRALIGNLLLAAETVKIVGLLRHRQVDAVTFKGPVLAEQVYGGIELRQFVDIDILVKPHDAIRALDVLAEAGYRGTTERSNPEYQSQAGQCAVRNRDHGITVDLHWKLTPFGLPFPFPESEIWDLMQEVPLAGATVPTFSWEHLALFLAFHGTKERWRKLKWICDFSALYVARPELDWEELRRKAALRHCSRSLLVAACLCDSLGLPAPAGLVEAGWGNRSVERLVCRVLSRLENPPEESDLSVFIDEIAATERMRDKARHALALLGTPTTSDLQALRLPARLRSLYYVSRPIRLVGKVAGLLYRSRAE